MNNIQIKTIPNLDQKYSTVGDYYWQDGDIQVRVSDMQNAVYEMAVVIHELTEIQWCLENNVTLEASTIFDIQFERERTQGLHKQNDEPGDDSRCPYWQGHQIATIVEKKFIKLMGKKWREYDKAVMSL